MLTKTVAGRKSLNSMLRHIAFHGYVELPCERRQRFEYNVIKQLHADGKIVPSRNHYGEMILVIRDSQPYHDESEENSIEPLVIHLALDNPKVEQYAKAFRKNYVVPELETYPIGDEQYDINYPTELDLS